MRDDLRFAVRGLARDRGFTLIVVLMLAVGIGSTTAIFAVVDGTLLRPFPFPDQHRLVALDSVDRENSLGTSFSDLEDWRARAGTFELLEAQTSETMFLSGLADPEQLVGLFTSRRLLSRLGLQLALGRSFVPEEDRPGGAPVVLLSHALWRRAFGADPTCVGRSIILNGQPFTVVGVLGPEAAIPPQMQFDLVRPFGQIGQVLSADEFQNRGGRALQVLGWLRPGVTVDEARRTMTHLAAALAREHPDTNRGVTVAVVPLREEVIGSLRTTIWLLFGSVAFVLILACANVVHLQLSRAVIRGREYAVRAALGAGQWALARPLLTESVVLAGLSTVIGFACVAWEVDLLKTQLPTWVPEQLPIRVDWRIATFSSVVGLFTVGCFGVVAPMYAARMNPADGLRSSGSRPDHASRSLRGWLVTVEIGLALTLAIGAGLMLHSLAKLHAVDVGFEPNQLSFARIHLPISDKYRDPSRQEEAFWKDLSARLQASPDLIGMGLVWPAPLSVGVDAEYHHRRGWRGATWHDPHSVRQRDLLPDDGRSAC